jgi:hypothetical protein
MRYFLDGGTRLLLCNNIHANISVDTLQQIVNFCSLSSA